MRRTAFASQPVIVAALLLASAYTVAAAGIDYLIAESGPDVTICESTVRMESDDDLNGAYRRAVVRSPTSRDIRRSPRAGPDTVERHWQNHDVSFSSGHGGHTAQRRPDTTIDTSAKAA